ncbi:hypothetical protein [Planococcus sp. YIM B11945]|uniref:hypothetical protein n=1 Tax=Planococcus sp. YIM B11945 TaxID=3435410 RepID=UPI003D7EAEBF
MKFVLFYFIPLVVYIVLNNAIDQMSWPYFILVMASFLLFQMTRLRFPKDAPLPFTTKLANWGFYALTVAFVFRDQFLNPLIVNVGIGITVGLVIIDLFQTKKELSS